MRNIILFILLTLLHTPLYSQWINTDCPIWGRGINTIVNHNGRIFAGSDGIWISSDSGNSWVARNNGLPIDFSVSEKGLLAYGTNNLLAASQSGPVFRSNNGGGAWEKIETSHEIHSLFLSSDKIIGVSAKSIFTSADYGTTWRPSVMPVSVDQIEPLNVSCKVFNDTTYLAIQHLGFFYSLDDGLTWQKELRSGIPSGGRGISSLSVIGNTLYAGVGRMIYARNTDNNWKGLNSISKSTTSGQGIAGVFASGENLYTYFHKDVTGKIYKSTNQGLAWNKIDLFEDGIPAGYVSTAAAVANRFLLGHVWRGVLDFNPSTGRTTSASRKIPSDHYSVYTTENVTFIKGNPSVNGNFVLSNDRGNSWINTSSSFESKAGIDIAYVYEGHYFVITSNGIYKSSDKGATWLSAMNGLVSEEFSGNEYHYMYYKNKNLYLISGSGKIYSSSNLGQNWYLIDSADSDYQWIKIFFIDDHLYKIGTKIDKLQTKFHYLSKEGNLINIEHHIGFDYILKRNNETSKWENISSNFPDSSLSLKLYDFKNVIYMRSTSKISKTAIVKEQDVEISKKYNSVVHKITVSKDRGKSWSTFSKIWTDSIFISVMGEGNGIVLLKESQYYKPSEIYPGKILASIEGGEIFEITNEFPEGILTDPTYSLYSTTNKIFLNTLNKGIWMSMDGRSWSKSDNGMTSADTNLVIHQKGDTLFAFGGNYYYSIDEGATWQSIVSMPENIVARDFQVTDRDIFAFTRRDGVYRLPFESVLAIDAPAEEQGVGIYPNPAFSSIHVKMKDSSIGRNEYHIYDGLGIEVYRGVINADSSAIDVENLNEGIYLHEGIYLLKIKDGASFRNGKFLIKR